jgi:hypothetical protein
MRTPTFYGLLFFFLVATASCKREREVRRNISSEELAGLQEGAQVKRAEIVSAWPGWLERPEGCPADAMPTQFQEHEVSLEACQGELIKTCLRKCEFFDAAACYGAALILESPDISVDRVSPALFARACKFGSASGCTNWTAGMVVGSLDPDEPRYTACQERSFEISCTRGQDPWGCAMFAHALAEKGPSQADLTRIEKAAAVACRLGEDDPACKTGKGIVEALRAKTAVNP